MDIQISDQIYGGNVTSEDDSDSMNSDMSDYLKDESFFGGDEFFSAILGDDDDTNITDTLYGGDIEEFINDTTSDTALDGGANHVALRVGLVCGFLHFFVLSCVEFF